MADGTWRVVVYPPYEDDQWGHLWAEFDENTFWHAESKQSALNRLQHAFENPRDLSYKDVELSKDTLEFIVHPDFEDEISREEIAQTGLAGFGISADGRFDTDDNHWRYQHPAYSQYVTPLIDPSDSTDVLEATIPRDDGDHIDDWQWTYAMWAKQAPGGGIDIWLHEPRTFEWQRWDSVDEALLVQVLDGAWPLCSGEPTVTRYRTIAGSDDASIHDWPGVESATVTTHRSTERTPFDDSFDYCPNAPTAVNDWEYQPKDVHWRDVWESPCGEKAVIVKHNSSDFSWFKVADRRLSRAGRAFTPNGYPSKRSADYSEAEAREAAIEWMETHDPGLWKHPGYTPELYSSPEGWTLEENPTVSSDLPRTLTATYLQPAEDDYERVIRVTGPIGSTDFEVHLAYRRPHEASHKRHDWCYYDDAPVDLSERVTVERAYDAACRLAGAFDGPSITGDPRILLDAYEQGEIRGTGPKGAVTADTPHLDSRAESLPTPSSPADPAAGVPVE